MNKQKRTYSESFKEQAISLLRSSDRSAADIERELGITPGLLSRWNRKKAKREGDVIAPRSNQLLADQPPAERLKQLERENARLRHRVRKKRPASAGNASCIGPADAGQGHHTGVCLGRLDARLRQAGGLVPVVNVVLDETLHLAALGRLLLVQALGGLVELLRLGVV